jgi:hypothetical protein
VKGCSLDTAPLSDPCPGRPILPIFRDDERPVQQAIDRNEPRAPKQRQDAPGVCVLVADGRDLHPTDMPATDTSGATQRVCSPICRTRSRGSHAAIRPSITKRRGSGPVRTVVIGSAG